MRHRYSKTIEWTEGVPRAGAFNSSSSDWSGARHTVRAVAAAPTGNIAAAQYGFELNHVITLTLPKNCEITENSAVWFDHDAAPWGMVQSVRRYPRHVEADVKKAVLR